MALQTIDDHSLAESLFEVFRSHGFEGTTLSLLSEVTGLKKSSLYHRFPAGKDDMAKAVVLYISSQLKNHLFEPLLNSSTPPEKRFNEMLITVKEFYDDGRKNCLLNVLSLGEAKPEIKELLNLNYDSWLNALIKLGKEAGLNQKVAKARSEHFLVVVEGALVIQRLTGSHTTLKSSLKYEKEQFFK